MCGCPHKVTDNVCSYCGSSLSRRISVSERLRQAVETVKWRYRMKGRRHSTSLKLATSKLVTLLLGVALALLGGAFFVSAVGSSSFSEFLVGSLFLVYGVYSCYTVLKEWSRL